MTNTNATKKDIDHLETKIDNLETKLETKIEKEIKDSEKRLDKNFTTRLNASIEAFRNEIQYQFQLQDERWERHFTAFESRMYTLVDPLLREMETRQQDRELTTAQIKDLDKRVTKLENS